MMTIIANSVGEMTPISRPMLSTISSISPRVFMSMPSAADIRQSRPVNRAAAHVPPNLPSVATRMITAVKPHACQPETRPISRAHARVRKERRQQQNLHDVFQLVLEIDRHVGVVRNDGPQQERAENRVDADPFGRHRRKQQGHQHPNRHPSLRCFGIVPEEANGQRPHDERT